MKTPGHILPFAVLLAFVAFLSGCGGSSGTSTVTPTPTATTTSLATSATSAVSGTAITLTATVSPSAATGTVTFYDGTTSLGTGTLASGTATLSISTLAVGGHSVTATYGGSGSTYASSTSSIVAVAITPLLTTTTFISPVSATAGASVTFTAAVNPTAATGTVTFYDGATALGTGTLSAGTATFATSSLAPGVHSVYAVYAGAGVYAGSTSLKGTLTINAIASTTVLTSSVAKAATGAPILFTATVNSTSATGTVTFYDGATSLGTGTLTSGVATLSVSTLFAGLHSITAVYAGAGNYATSTSNALAITILQATTTSLTASGTAVNTGTLITFTATVAPSAATGTVTFYDGATSLGTSTLSSGTATFALSTLATGNHAITAVYSGDAGYANSTSPVVNVIVAALVLTTNATTATAGTNVTFTATIAPSTTTGTLTFYDGSTSIGTGALSSGTAILTISTLSPGVHFVTAVLATANATSNGVAVTINKAATTPITGTYSGPSITGKVMAGALPVTGASVQFYAAGTTGNGIAAGNLIASAITTSSSGSFTIPSGYTCPLPTTQVYLVATGGTTAASSSSPIEFLSALGSCNVVPTTVVVNEVTTVAATWPLAQFLSTGGSIGATSTNTTGLANAFLIAASLASTTTGTSPGATYPANASSITPRLDALANVLNTCSASSSACTSFFAATGTGPTNTLDAALSVVLHPAVNAATLYTLSRNSTAFTPALTSAPADWTLFSTISGGGLNQPSTVGILSTGNVWVANYSGGVASQFTPLGAAVFTNGIAGPGLTASYGLAVDQANNAWIPNDIFSGTVTKISSDGTTSSVFSGAGLDFPVFTAIDPDGSVWVADYGSSAVTHLSNAGVALSGPNGYQNTLTPFPTALAVDASHNVWVNDQSGTTVTRIAQDGTNALQVNCCDGPTSIAIDQRGNVWVASFYTSTIVELSNAGAVLNTGFSGGGMFRPQALAIDGVGSIWVANFYTIGISEFAGSQSSTPGAALSPSNGFAPDGPAQGNFSISVDASGNVWVADFNANVITRYLGLAAPTKSPAIGLASAP